MDKPTVHEMICPIFGNYCHDTGKDLRLIGRCTDLSELLGNTPEELEGKRLYDILTKETAEETVSAVRLQIDSLSETEMLMSLTRSDGTSVCVLSRGRVVCDRSGNEYVEGVFVVANRIGNMISDLRRKVASYSAQLSQTENRISALRIRAEQDSLTKIFNASTTRRLSEEYIAGTRGKCAMLIIDVDDFKRINDRYGHMVGDDVMTCAASAIKKLFRSNDIVGRVGGDEFLVLMKDVPDIDIVKTRCSQIVSAFNKMQFDIMENELMSCSVGAAVLSDSDVSYNELFLCADKAMYSAKNMGGNRFVVEEYK